MTDELSATKRCPAATQMDGRPIAGDAAQDLRPGG